MSLVKNSLETRVQIKFNTGIDETGKPVYRVKSLNSVKASATDEDVMAIAQALATLQQYSVVSITRVDQNELANE